jgi:hypothetical protein
LVGSDADEAVVWEHLGRLDDPAYVAPWERNKRWYAELGLVEGETLFWASEVGGLDVGVIDAVVERVANALS